MLLTDFGAVPANPLTLQGPDCTPAFHAAYQASLTRGDFVLEIPQGKWRCASPLYFPSTLFLKGCGITHPGERGSVIIADYNDSPTNGFITFDGSVPNQGGGSGISGVVIYKGLNRAGGRAIVIKTESPSQREGWIQLDRVVVGGYDYAGFTPAVWDQCLFIDGTATPVPPGQRDGWIHYCDFSAARGTSVQLMGITMVIGEGIKVFPGQGTNGDVMISGTEQVPSSGFHFSGLSIFGKLIVGYANQFTLRGRTTGIQVMTVAEDGLIEGVGLAGPPLDGNGKPWKDKQAIKIVTSRY